MRKMILRWELAGIGLIIVAGSALHFVFEWTGYWRPAALIAVVNESTWEHLKLAFWPGLIFALVEYPFIRKAAHNVWVAKGLGLLTMPVVIVALFYGYKVILGRDYLWINVSIFALAAVAGQLVSYRILIAPRMGQAAQWSGVILLLILIAAFSSFTYRPPRLSLFEDPSTHGYGILDGSAR
jgi:hypothetical protein